MSAEAVVRTARGVLDGLLERTGRLHVRCAGRYPLYRPAGGDWVTSRRGSWTGGLWAGLLWLRALESGRGEHLEHAVRATTGLDGWTGADTATRGLIFWYPLALSRLAVPGGVPEVEAAAGRCAHSLAARSRPAHGVVPWGTAFGGEGDLVRVDGAPGVAPLLRGATGATEATARAGTSHLLRHLELCAAGDAVAPVWLLRPDGAPPVRSPEPLHLWSRGRAWLSAALADALSVGAVEWDDPVVATALAGHGEPLVPPADARDPQGPGDTGASAIEAAALLRATAHAAPGDPRAERARLRAHLLVAHLAAHHLGADGGLSGGSYEVRGRLLTGLETVWGDFFLALAAALVTGAVPADRV
ncbi:hypothetical protein [Nocardiopsis sp. CC223A]|uniref:hypothetical protein n=1 Tax=Nocardiopsis sp. CC223A TaxID=3044051 RepID=UPI00278BC71F|nr:hypothetical protein [Nocardiopsis sp. CC223A]